MPECVGSHPADYRHDLRHAIHSVRRECYSWRENQKGDKLILLFHNVSTPYRNILQVRAFVQEPSNQECALFWGFFNGVQSHRSNAIIVDGL